MWRQRSVWVTFDRRAGDSLLPQLRRRASHGGGAVNPIPNAISMESGGSQKMVNGALASEAPGIGSDLSRDYIKKYKVG